MDKTGQITKIKKRKNTQPKGVAGAKQCPYLVESRMEQRGRKIRSRKGLICPNIRPLNRKN